MSHKTSLPNLGLNFLVFEATFCAQYSVVVTKLYRMTKSEMTEKYSFNPSEDITVECDGIKLMAAMTKSLL